VLNILVCVKRVPETGARITLTADEQAIDTTHLGFTISPHEECAVEEAIRLAAEHGGATTVLTLGPAPAVEQLQNAIAMGVENAVLIETDGDDWGPEETAAAIADAIRAQAQPIDLLLFGNESADNGNYQVAIRVAVALGLPYATGIKGIELQDGTALARREAGGGWEIFEVPLPAVIAVREGINLPRYPSLPGRLRAKKTEVQRIAATRREAGLEKIRLAMPQEDDRAVEILGDGATAAPRVLEVLRDLGLVDA
jgi:electron transfer flavoprotein beta subunit